MYLSQIVWSIELPATIPTDIAELKEVSGIEDQ
jgi:hypothetical protein